MKPWKSCLLPLISGGRPWLQWGHGDEAVEERPHHVAKVIGTQRLQWGHGDEAVEEVPVVIAFDPGL